MRNSYKRRMCLINIIAFRKRRSLIKSVTQLHAKEVQNERI